VNLSLEVLGKRADGYHDLVTILQAVDLSDRLTLEAATTIELKTTDEELPADQENLIWQAALLLRDAAGIDGGARITLDKRIPVAAGLGGGSSDAAAALWGLNHLWGLRWSTERLSELAVRLGMDVPFFLLGGRALATGRGELLERLPSARGFALVLVNPRVPVSTRQVYSRVPPTLRGDGSRTRALITALATGNSSRVAGGLYNNLEPVVEPLYPAVSSIKRALLDAGALGAVMSGSGPTVFGFARSYDHARQIRNRVLRGSWSCWAVRTLSGPAIRIIHEASGRR